MPSFFATSPAASTAVTLATEPHNLFVDPRSITNVLFPAVFNATGGPVDEIKCYALPYGTIGVISHLLTYWTMAWLSVGRVPIWPGHRMKTYAFDMFLAILSLGICIPVASITMRRCLLSWQFVLISVWKLVTSVSLGCITLHRCIIVRRNKKFGYQSVTSIEMANHNYFPRPSPQSHYGQSPAASGYFSQPSQQNRPARGPPDLTPLNWLILYLAGTVVGMVGLASLIYTTYRKNDTIRYITYAYAGTLLIIPIMAAIYWYIRHLNSAGEGRKKLLLAYFQTLGGAVVAFAAVFGFFSSMYSDLVLGSIANNAYGLPSADFAPLYWAWFVAKRLPMLSGLGSF